MARDLTVYLRGESLGTLRQEDSGRLTFTYRDEWLARPEARPLSLSLPLHDGPFDDRVARPFFAGLLPDESARERLARYLGVSRHNAFALLAEVGGECAGAVAVYPPGTRPPSPGVGDLEPLDEATLAALLLDLPRRPLLAGGELRLSLAGAQDKMALVRRDGTFYLPRGDLPTTHILKPAIGQFADVTDLIVLVDTPKYTSNDTEEGQAQKQRILDLHTVFHNLGWSLQLGQVSED